MYGGITCMRPKKGTNMLGIILRNTNMVVFMWCIAHRCAFDSSLARQPRSDTAKTGLPPLDSSQLSDK
jgi:hypothetical protein